MPRIQLTKDQAVLWNMMKAGKWHGYPLPTTSAKQEMVESE